MRSVIKIIIVHLLFLTACKTVKKEPVLFEALESERTGLKFSNDLDYNKDFNLFKYMYFYNGSGVAAGDLNNDGLIDLYFGSNQHQNKMYLNTGGLHFKDVTAGTQIPDDGGWTTGLSLVDINNDGLLDIYVCRVGQYEVLKSKNLFLICQGINKQGVPFYQDEATQYGLDFSGFSTQAAFFDYDLDGDLDMYLMNHSVHENGTFRPRKDFAGTFHPLSGDRIFRNDNGHFSDVTKQTGIESSAIGYGLGIAIADINLDGYPDIYIGNDFHEDDYLYINQKNGTFKQESEQMLMHTSQFSMGVDVADVNNDAYPEIISLDMLPSDPYILKRSLGEDSYDIFKYKTSVGYSHQYARNAFQYNRRNGMFSEIGLYSGIAATDWRWAPLWVDFDNDGLKDLFISNGIPKRMNDIDYVNFISNQEIQDKIKSNNMEGRDMALIEKFPQIKLPNKFYLNNGELTFRDMEGIIGNDQPTFSNGAAYADFDNDGDLDIIVNNIDAPAILYENKKNNGTGKDYLKIDLRGSSSNIRAVGAKIVLFEKQQVRTYEKFATKGFLSAMETPLLIGMGTSKPDSVFLIWPDNTFQKLAYRSTDTLMFLTYRHGLPAFNYRSVSDFYKDSTFTIEEIAQKINFNYEQKENRFNEFDREPLIPQEITTEGPAIAVADINHDNLDDVFIGSARNAQSVLFIQRPNGSFTKLNSQVLAADSIYEDVSATWVDVNNDHHIDLVVASGGNEFFGEDFHNSPRVYLNDGRGNLSKKEDAFHKLFVTASVVAASDFNNDGYQDLFIGGRAVPWEYGKIPRSYLLLNDKTGRFTDVTDKVAPGLFEAGMITDAVWTDLNGVGKNDLLVSVQWGCVTAFMNNKGIFEKKELAPQKGWWNFVLPFDADGDGDTDIVAGNLGLNSRLKASAGQPVTLYYNDFDDNGKKEQVLTHYLGGREIPFANMAELQRQMPGLKKKYLYAEDFAKAGLTELFEKSKLRKADKLTAGYFSNALFINNGNMEFKVSAFPFEAQFSPMKDAVIVQANEDSLPDILIAGNFYENNIQMGRYDADFGTLLMNKGNNRFLPKTLNGLVIRGQVRHIVPVKIKGSQAYIIIRNEDSAQVIKFKS